MQQGWFPKDSGCLLGITLREVLRMATDSISLCEKVKDLRQRVHELENRLISQL